MRPFPLPPFSSGAARRSNVGAYLPIYLPTYLTYRYIRYLLRGKRRGSRFAGPFSLHLHAISGGACFFSRLPDGHIPQRGGKHAHTCMGYVYYKNLTIYLGVTCSVLPPTSRGLTCILSKCCTGQKIDLPGCVTVYVLSRLSQVRIQHSYRYIYIYIYI